MNKLQIFNSAEFGEIRTVTIDNEPWFVGKDVALALGYSNASKAVSVHVEEEDRILKVLEADSQNGNVVKTQTALINESGLYALIFGSKLESAKRFKHWVTSEVLPTIRKTGSYQKPMTTAEQIQLLAQGNQDHEERIEKLENTMTIDYGQQKYISDLVSKVVIEVLGGKKSNVCTMAISSEILYTAASSLLSYPTSNDGSCSPLGSFSSTRLSTPAPSLAVQPPPLQKTIFSSILYINTFFLFCIFLHAFSLSECTK